jgi:Tfp pilus assembly protein PilX
MLTRVRLSRQDGSALITALMVMMIILPFGLALLSIVDTQAHDSGKERSRDRAFNLADSALTSGAFALNRYAWPATAAGAPSNTSASGSAALCGTVPYGATLGASTFAGSATARLQPNLNASYDDAAYTGATWQLNVCDDDPTHAGPTVWKDTLLTSQMNYDANANQLAWIRSEAHVDGRKRVVAALVRVTQSPALSSKYGLVTGRMNADITNSVGAVLGGGLLNQVSTRLLGTEPLVAADPLHVTSPPSSGVTAVRCGALDGCLTGAIGGAAALPAVNTLVTGGKLVQSTSPMAASAASIAQLKQQAMITNTYVASAAGSASSSSPPACPIPAGANANTIVYIEQVGVGTVGSTVGGPGDQFCVLDVSSNVSFKALIIGSGRVVLRGNNTTAGGTFTGLVYALNQQRATAQLGDAATPTREVIRIDRGAHVRGGVAADGKSAQVGVYPPPVCNANSFLNLDCLISGIVGILGILDDYNPAIRSDVSVMNNVKIFESAGIERGTYRDIAGEVR